MFIEEIKFPEDFDVKESGGEGYYTIISMENAKWGLRDLHIIVRISVHGEGCDAIICIGKDVDQLYGDRKEIIDRINYNVCKFFRKKAKEKELYYRY